jgi:WD40 repeat protein
MRIPNQRTDIRKGKNNYKWMSTNCIVLKFFFLAIFFALSIGGCASMDIKTGNGIIEHVDTIQNQRGYGTEVLRWHPDSRHLAVSTDSGKYIFIWDTKKNRLDKRLDKLDTGAGQALAYSFDGKYLVGKRYPKECISPKGNNVGCLSIWSVEDDYRLVAQSNFQPLVGLRTAPDGRIFTFSSGSHKAIEPKMTFFEIPSFARFESHIDLDGPDTLAFSHDGKLMAEGYKTFGPVPFDPSGNQYHLRMWKYPEMELLWEKHDVHNGNIRSIVFSPDNKTIVTGPYSSDEKFLKNSKGKFFEDKAFMEPMKVWDANTGNFIRNLISLGRTPKHLWFVNDRHILGVTKINREIIIWDFISGKELDRVTIAKDNFVFNAEISPDKKTLAFGKIDKVLLFKFNLPKTQFNDQ